MRDFRLRGTSAQKHVRARRTEKSAGSEEGGGVGGEGRGGEGGEGGGSQV